MRVNLNVGKSKRSSYSLYAIDDEQKGAISVILAILFPILIISLFAIVIDVGQIYRERRELVRAADAVALFIAQECVDGKPCPANSSAYQNYADLNVSDGKIKIDEICGFNSRTSTQIFSECSQTQSTIFNCKDSSVFNRDSSSINYVYSFVRVRVSTLSDSNSPFLKLFFAPLLRGASDELGLSACSQAAWAPALAVPVIYPLALPICSYENTGPKLFLGFRSNDPVYNNSQVPDPCVYTPFGSTIQITDTIKYYLKGATIYNKVDGEEFLCPSPTSPRLLRIGQILEVQSSSSQIVQDCKNMLTSIGYSPGNAADYGRFLDDYLLGTKLYVPILGECKNQANPSQCKAFEIVAFATVRIYGIKLTVTSAETGTGPTGFPGRNNLSPSTAWNNNQPLDCPSDVYCIFGEFERSAPPTKPIPLSSQGPQPIDTGTQRIFLLP